MKIKIIISLVFFLISIYATAQKPDIEVRFTKPLETRIPGEKPQPRNETSGKGNAGENTSGRGPAMSKPMSVPGKWNQFNTLANGGQISAVSVRHINRLKKDILTIRGLQALLVGSALISLYSEDPKDFIGNNITSIYGVSQEDLKGLAEGINNLRSIINTRVYQTATDAMLELDDLKREPSVTNNVEAKVVITREYAFWNNLANTINSVKSKPFIPELPDPDNRM